jgi:hypothetical protein
MSPDDATWNVPLQTVDDEEYMSQGLRDGRSWQNWVTAKVSAEVARQTAAVMMDVADRLERRARKHADKTLTEQLVGPTH